MPRKSRVPKPPKPRKAKKVKVPNQGADYQKIQKGSSTANVRGANKGRPKKNTQTTAPLTGATRKQRAIRRPAKKKKKRK